MLFPECVDFLIRHELTASGLFQPFANRRARLVIEHDRSLFRHREHRDSDRILILRRKLPHFLNRLPTALCYRQSISHRNFHAVLPHQQHANGTRCPTGMSMKLRRSPQLLILFAFSWRWGAVHCSKLSPAARVLNLYAITLRKNRVVAKRPAFESCTLNTLRSEATNGRNTGASPALLALRNQCFAATVAPKRLHCGHDVSARQRMGEPHLCPTLLAIGMDIFRGRDKNTRSQLHAILGQRRVAVSEACHRGRPIIVAAISRQRDR
jgi:hypothetical protein